MISCDGALPAGQRVHVSLFRGLSSIYGLTEAADVELLDQSGALLARGYESRYEPGMWTDSRVATELTLVRDWIEPVAHASIGLDYAVTEEKDTVRGIDGAGNYTFVATGNRRGVSVTGGTVGVEGVTAADLSCSGEHFELKLTSSYPAWFVHHGAGLFSEQCSASNSTYFSLFGSGHDALFGYTFTYADHPDVVATSSLLPLRAGTWDGPVELTRNGEFIGEVSATATLEQSGPTERFRETPWPEGYFLEWTLTPMTLTVWADGPGSGVEATCELTAFRLFTRLRNG